MMVIRVRRIIKIKQKQNKKSYLTFLYFLATVVDLLCSLQKKPSLW